jgi:hypothetical protein
MTFYTQALLKKSVNILMLGTYTLMQPSAIHAIGLLGLGIVMTLEAAGAGLFL